ncbi:MAG: DUF2071 domain-containing protein [Terracidiphilus sp.]
MQQFLLRTSHRPRPLPPGRWVVTERWNDLLFAHWPLPAQTLTPLLPPELMVDLWEGSAWLGVAPCWIDRIKFRGLPALPGGRSRPGLNMRTYVRDRQSGAPGVFLLSMETNSLLAAGVGRFIYHLPYHLAEMVLEQRSEREFEFYSRRHFSAEPVLFKARYRGLGPTRRLAEMRPGALESFLLERYSVFMRNRAGATLRAHLHHVGWPLEEAEAEIEQNDLPAAAGIRLPGCEPVFFYARRMAAYIWPMERVTASVSARPVTVAVTPS